MGLPEALVKAVSLQKHNEPGQLSATTLLNGVKQIHLRDRHWSELEEDVADHVYALFGTAVHEVLNDEGVDEFAEEFISSEMDGIVVTGRIDNYNMRSCILSDYKTASVWKIKFGNFEDWRLQGLIYAWLLNRNGFDVQTCRFVAFIKDHSKRDAKRDSSYPQKPTCVYDFPVTEKGLEEIETYIKAKIADYKKTLETADDNIPPCSAEERWEKPTKYAVKKEGRKTAVRVMDSIEEAERLAADLGKNHSVEIRLGESTRCMEYCSCNIFCNFYRDTVVAAEELAELPA
jgi:hypothetical protein